MEYFETVINPANAVIQPLPPAFAPDKSCQADVLRLDKIHQVISGNKWFKLKYHLAEAIDSHYDSILTSGGYYSNHIVAAALAARQAGLKSAGIIRGERPAVLSHTLEAATAYGMHLHFVSREEYKRREELDFSFLAPALGNIYIIPEGGASAAGRRGSREIISLAGSEKYSHIMAAIGTGTMFCGLADASPENVEVIGIPVLKGFTDLEGFLQPLLEKPDAIQKCRFFYDYHFGGYARQNQQLIGFMNSFHEQTGIPSDFVYTAKLFFAYTDLLQKNYFPPDSKILLIHSGGLQGNLSLPPGCLKY